MADTFAGPTWLYHQDGSSRLFAEGEEHPGEGWFDHPRRAAGEPEPEPVEPPAEGNTWGEALGAQFAAGDVPAEIERLEREKAEILEEARGRIDGLNGQVEAAGVRIFELNGEVETLTQQLATDRETIASQAAEIERLKAEVAKFDPDGDGKAGGARKKGS